MSMLGFAIITGCALMVLVPALAIKMIYTALSTQAVDAFDVFAEEE